MKTQKLFLFTCCLCTLLWSCSKEEQAASETEGEAMIDVMVQDFQFTSFTLTKDNNKEEASVKESLTDAFRCLTIAVFNRVNGEKVCEFNQEALQEDFGFFRFSLPFGQYSLVAIGYEESQSGRFCHVKSLEEVDLRRNKVPETFSASQQFEVSSTEAKTLVMKLDRRVARFSFTTTDIVPASCSNSYYLMVVKGVGSLLNPLTGLAAHADSIVVNGIVNVGAPLSKALYCFLPEDSCSVQVRIDILKSSGDSLDNHPQVMLSRTFKDVPLQRNHKTEASGTFFQQSTLQISADTEWGSPYTYTY